MKKAPNGIQPLLALKPKCSICENPLVYYRRIVHYDISKYDLDGKTTLWKIGAIRYCKECYEEYGGA